MRLRIHCPATNLPNRTHGAQSTHHKQEDEVLHFMISDSRAPLDLLPAGYGEDLAYLARSKSNTKPAPRLAPLIGRRRLFSRHVIAIPPQFSLMSCTWELQGCRVRSATLRLDSAHRGADVLE